MRRGTGGLLALLFVICVYATVHANGKTGKAARPKPAVAAFDDGADSTAVIHLRDEVHLLKESDRGQLNTFLTWIETETGIDMRIHVVRAAPPDSAFEDLALHEMRAHRVGRGTNRMGALFLVDMASHRMRVEIGPGLEGYFTDSFMGDLMRRHMPYFFATDDVAKGFDFFLRMLLDRIRRSELHEDYYPLPPMPSDTMPDPRRYATGAGVTWVVQPQRNVFVAHVDDPQWRKLFVEQPTPMQALDLFHDWQRSGRNLTDVALLTFGTQQYLSQRFPMTPAYDAFLSSIDNGVRFQFDERGALAIAVPYNDPLAEPHFFRRDAVGWQIDLMAEIANTQDLVGYYPWSWRIRDGNDGFYSTFRDRWYSTGPPYNLTRVKGGDNREFPLATPQ